MWLWDSGGKRHVCGASPWARVEVSVLSAAVEMRSQEHILGWVTTKAIHEHPLSKALWSVSYFTAHLFRHEDPESWLGYWTWIIPWKNAQPKLDLKDLVCYLSSLKFVQYLPSKDFVCNFLIMCGNRKRKQSKVSCMCTYGKLSFLLGSWLVGDCQGAFNE